MSLARLAPLPGRYAYGAAWGSLPSADEIEAQIVAGRARLANATDADPSARRAGVVAAATDGSAAIAGERLREHAAARAALLAAMPSGAAQAVRGS